MRLILLTEIDNNYVDINKLDLRGSGVDALSNLGRYSLSPPTSIVSNDNYYQCQ